MDISGLILKGILDCGLQSTYADESTMLSVGMKGLVALILKAMVVVRSTKGILSRDSQRVGMP
jgi:hypothetical protein